MKKLSLAMIVKPSVEEAELLDRCLKYLHNNVDEICITQAGKEPIKEVSEVIQKYDGKEFFFQWENDFAKARNYSFSVTTGDYIFWCDADDIVKEAELLKPLIEKMEEEAIDATVMNYLYDFDDNKKCTVKHLKTRIVKRDVVEWVGEIHEDFSPLRELNSMFTDEIEILHLTNKDRAERASERNIEIARIFMEKHPGDPRGEWLVANALLGEGKEQEAVKYLQKFIDVSNSEEEIFIAYLRIGDILQSEENYLKALSIRPNYPDAYLKIGELLSKTKHLFRARDFILEGLKKQIPERSIIVYNPRDYDFNPMMILANIYFQLKEFKNAIEVLKRCKKIYPEDENIKQYENMLNKEQKIEEAVDDFLKKAELEKDKAKLKELCDKFEYQSHPRFCIFKNINFVKETSTGKDLVYYCSYTDKIWNPNVAEKDGVGGSEEAVINLSRELVKLGWNVTVYNNCGHSAKEYEGVIYKPYWEFNIKDKQDVIILWRHPRPVDFNLNADKILLDLHDVLPEGELTQDRVDKFHRVMVKTKAHRDLFPKVSDEKFEIVPNGINLEQFELFAWSDNDQEFVPATIKKDPYLILNTSSPDRHIDATLDIFEELIKRQPDKPWKLAWYYGWDNFLMWHKDNKELMSFYEKQNERFQKLVEQGRAEGGKMISHREIAKKYLEAGIFLYPTQFYEIHCISATKAQAAGCVMITSDFAALDEIVQHGWKIHTDGFKWKKENTFGDNYNIDDYLKAIENYSQGNFIKKHEVPREKEWAKQNFNWSVITNKWNNIL